ncbi:DUF4198 domain-containing protein [Pseudomonas sp. P9_31]|uniref:DUF4198 domain-containing protein n=1 Tax=Pseudomonas sp. P9_31 TaxID=3043448 RepID=UPI002A36FAC4|nr:DUF4198 domain-containing protein [Pseudomonas sp. P9_31]WPN55444.1 DUF4198 domain-containing protein [Pseudomonas sp. P9_31]
MGVYLRACFGWFEKDAPSLRSNWTGSVFRAVVLADGKPAPFAEVEIEYLNHSVDVENNAFGQQDYVTAPQASFKALSTYTDDQGVLIIGLPRAGW